MSRYTLASADELVEVDQGKIVAGADTLLGHALDVADRYRLEAPGPFGVERLTLNRVDLVTMWLHEEWEQPVSCEVHDGYAIPPDAVV